MTIARATLPPEAPDRVLPTLNPDGTRRWLRPRLARGRFFRRRRIVGWALIVLFTALPYITISGKPAVLLDVAHRRFTLLGTTFLPTDAALLMLLLLGILVGIFFLTALLGRAWCGWACPQTVYMEFVFRPLERLIEGGPRAQAALDARGISARRCLKHVAVLAVSAFLAHTFLAYFVGVQTLARWVTRSPLEHPGAFLVMAGTTALMLLDFGWFREQVCLVACPYGRFQSVLLDRHSLLVAYRTPRGEPRAAGGARRSEPDRAFGDCVDCGACVAACPMGIDVRDGLQMECLHCAQCVDACDAVMDGLRRPRGLVGYGSQAELAGEPRRWIRPRVLLYPVVLLAVWGALAIALVGREDADVTILRVTGAPFTVLPSGEVSNAIRVKIANRTDADRAYLVALDDAPGVTLFVPDNPVHVAAAGSATTVVLVTARAEALPGGQREVRFRVSDGAGFITHVPYRVLGPVTARSGS